MCVYYKFTPHLHLPGPNYYPPFPLPPGLTPLSCLMMNLFEGHFLYEQRLGCIFLSFFPSVKWVYCPWGKSCSENKSGYDPLCVYYFFIALSWVEFRWACLPFVRQNSGVWQTPPFALLKWNLADYLAFLLISVWAKKQNPNGWTNVLCSVNI